MDELIETIEPKTGFSDKLNDAHQSLVRDLTETRDLTVQPGKVSLLSEINQIVQNQRLVVLGGQILTEIQELRTVEAPVKQPGILLAADQCTPRFRRMRGTEEIDISGATEISVEVRAGEVVCSNGDGLLEAPVKVSWSHPHGLTDITLGGTTADADYLVSWVARADLPVVASPQTGIIVDDLSEPEELEQPLTGDLLPSPLSLENPDDPLGLLTSDPTN